MFILKVPDTYSKKEELENRFLDMSLSFKTEIDPDLTHPVVLEGKKSFTGEEEINSLFAELNGYYGEHYNCSCAR